MVAGCLHDELLPDGRRVPRTWIFCPDQLCLCSAPKGSSLPPWSKHIPMLPGLNLTEKERRFIVQEFGLVPVPMKAA